MASNSAANTSTPLHARDSIFVDAALRRGAISAAARLVQRLWSGDLSAVVYSEIASGSRVCSISWGRITSNTRIGRFGELGGDGSSGGATCVRYPQLAEA